MSRFSFRVLLLCIRTKAAKDSASSSKLDIFQVQTGACSSLLIPCGGEGILCVLVQNDWSCMLVYVCSHLNVNALLSVVS
jgi:hypothetical protein